MIYLYYYDGKLRNAPTKMQSDSKIVESLNKWTKKIDATNGYTNCINRFIKLRNEANPDKDYHVLTNSVAVYTESIREYDVVVFTYNAFLNTWKLTKKYNEQVESPIL